MAVATKRSLMKIAVCQILLMVGWKRVKEDGVNALLDLVEWFIEEFCYHCRANILAGNRSNPTIFDILYSMEMLSISKTDIKLCVGDYGQVPFVYPSLPDFPLKIVSVAVQGVDKSRTAHTSGEPSEKSFEAASHPDVSTTTAAANPSAVEDERPVFQSKPFDPDQVGFKSDEDSDSKDTGIITKDSGLKLSASTPATTLIEKKEEAAYEEDWGGSSTCPICVCQPGQGIGGEVAGTVLPSTTEMICCDNCNVWYHCHCLKVSFESVKNCEMWYCPNCQPSLKLKHNLRSKNRLTRKRYSNG